mmetsp:Transcript_20291/g.53239  ORF Transcript_20291/g.53239 Transcript_20291/m.53239 type:complete len:99 (+) Transcript_20291:89-385(+)
MAATRGTRSLALLALASVLAAAWVCAPAFVPAARGAASEALPSAPGAAATAAAGLAVPLLSSQPAFAADSPPGWPYVIVFIGVFFAVFVLPNIVFKGK